MTEVLYKDISGNWPQTSRVNQNSWFGGVSIGYFYRDKQKSGTGFLIKLISGTSNSFGLILTAAHVFCEEFKFCKKKIVFKFEREKFYASPLKESLDWSTLSSFKKDPITRNRISVPDDWVVCLVTKISKYIYTQTYVALDIFDNSFSIDQDSKVYTIGYPCPITMDRIKSIAPEATINDINDIKNCLCGGSKLICSEGKVIKSGKMLAISCSTASGMSGSPILIQKKNKLYVIGILFGGPASKIHFYCSRIVNSGNLDKRKIVKRLIKCLSGYSANSITVKTINIVVKALKESLTKKLSKKIVQETLEFISWIYTIALKLESISRKEFHHNLAFPIAEIAEKLNEILSIY